MSTKEMRWALEQRGMGSTAKAVLLVLAARSDRDGQCGDLSMADIAEAAEISRSTAKRALGQLQEACLIDASGTTRDNGSRGRNHYTLNPQGWVHSDPTPRATVTPPPVHSDPTPGSTVNQGGFTVTPPTNRENAGGGSTVNPHTNLLSPNGDAAARAEARPRATRDTRAPARTRTREEPTSKRRQKLADLNATATTADTRRLIADWQAGHRARVTDKLVHDMTEQVDAAIRAGYDQDCLAAALTEWNRRTDVHSAKALSWLYDDAVKRANTITDIDPDEVLGVDYWSPPVPPLEIDEGPTEARREWFRKIGEQHRAERLAEAKAVLARRAG